MWCRDPWGLRALRPARFRHCHLKAAPTSTRLCSTTYKFCPIRAALDRNVLSIRNKHPKAQVTQVHRSQASSTDLALSPLPVMRMQRTNWLLGLESCLSSAPCGWRTGCRWAGSGAPEWLWCSSSPWCWLSPLCSSLWKPGKWNPTWTRHTRTAPAHPKPPAEP